MVFKLPLTYNLDKHFFYPCNVLEVFTLIKQEKLTYFQ